MLKKFLIKAAMVALGLVLGALLLEIGLRIYNPYEQRVIGNRIILTRNKKYEMVNRNLPGVPERIVFTKNSLGFRGADKPGAGIVSVLSVIAVGGSTTECVFLPDGDDWPSLVGNSLRLHFRDFWINNAGLDGHSTFGHAVLISDYIVPLHPKVVLLLVGANEIGNTEERGEDTVNIRGRILFSSFKEFFQSVSAHSELFSLLLSLSRFSQARLRWLPHASVNLKTVRTVPYPDPDLNAVLREHSQKYVPLYEKRLRTCLALCRDNGILPVLITQPALFGSGIDPVTQRDLASIFAEDRSGFGRWKILELYNDATRKIALEQAVFLVDLARELPKNSSYFYDFFHYTVSGSSAVAEIVARRLRPYLAEKFPEFFISFPRP